LALLDVKDRTASESFDKIDMTDLLPAPAGADAPAESQSRSATGSTIRATAPPHVNSPVVAGWRTRRQHPVRTSRDGAGTQRLRNDVA
jgi:hypothetical protein